MGSPVVPVAEIDANHHRFWDKKNQALFEATAASGLADLFVTRANLQHRGKELNPAARLFGTSTRGLAANFTAESAAILSVAYLLHKTGHHKLERLTSIVNTSASGAAVAYGLTHR
jgi:hypothetical protein